MEITSVNNERIKELSKLQVKKYREEYKLFLIEGDHLIYEAYKAGYLKEVYTTDIDKYDYTDINIIKVSEEVLKKLSEQSSSTDAVGVCNFIEEKLDNNHNLLILDEVQDPGNLGTIIRSAVAFDFDILLGDNTVDIYNSKTIRSTEGMLFHVNYVKDNIEKFIDDNKTYIYYVADMDKGTNLKDLDLNHKLAIIMGNEGSGVSQLLKEKVNNFVHIGQSDKCESLNVGVASSIIMYKVGDK